MWSLNGRRAPFAASGEELFRLDGNALRRLVLQQIKSWDPNLQTLIAASDPVEIFPIAVRVSSPCGPWPSGSATLLGDAIHAMSLAGGSGANMALYDAGPLSHTLTTIAHGEAPLLPALTRSYPLFTTTRRGCFGMVSRLCASPHAEAS